jgi:chorismate lyase / 3-hydroxybenzoate synthase
MPILAAEGAILQLPVSTLDRAIVAKPDVRFAVRYVNRLAVRALTTQPGSILGVVGYGADRPDFLPAACPFVAAPLSPAIGDAVFEIWSATSPCRPVQFGPVTGACNDDLVFGAVALDEAGNSTLEAAVEAAYLGIFDFLDAMGFAAPIRFWNYLTAINDDDNGLERYRRFNVGRHQAFSARLLQPVPPAASGVGGHHGASVIYFLAGHEPAKAVENPRQVSAYSYPSTYGPRSPSFSRASIHALMDAPALFISGTASIVGHETRHRGDLQGQIAETIENLRALIGAAEQAAPAPLGDHWAFKVYLHRPADRDAVNLAIDAVFGPDCQRIFLRGDMCRAELLVEIEAFRHFEIGPTHQRSYDGTKTR